MNVIVWFIGMYLMFNGHFFLGMILMFAALSLK